MKTIRADSDSLLGRLIFVVCGDMIRERSRYRRYSASATEVFIREDAELVISHRRRGDYSSRVSLRCPAESFRALFLRTRFPRSEEIRA